MESVEAMNTVLRREREEELGWDGGGGEEEKGNWRHCIFKDFKYIFISVSNLQEFQGQFLKYGDL